ncbi:MAG: hypothetical protein ACJ741_12070 [Pyrinomonadaceae bacterium]
MKKVLLAFLFALALAASAAADTIYLRDGRILRGTVLGFLSGRIVVRLAPPVSGDTTAGGVSTQTPTQSTSGTGADAGGEIRFLRPAEIDRIEIEGRSLDEARYVIRNIPVTLGPNWIDSGVDVRRGQRVQVRANGTIYAGRARITPDGLRTTDPAAPLPRAAEGVLIGAVGTDRDSPVVELGSSRELTADRDGRLYLTVNRGDYTDARGAYNVQVRTERELPQRRADTARSPDDEDRGNDPFENRPNTPAPARSRLPEDSSLRPGNDPRSRSPRESTVTVPGTSRGTDTGLDLRAGDRVTVTASGRVVAGRRAGEVGPEGGQTNGVGAILGTRPVPNAGVGALIGYVRLANGQATQPFFIGSQQTFTVQDDGRLILLVNDDNYSDNGGSFSARVVVNGATP